MHTLTSDDTENYYNMHPQKKQLSTIHDKRSRAPASYPQFAVDISIYDSFSFFSSTQVLTLHWTIF